MSSRPVRRWPLVLIAAPAAVPVWSGWPDWGALCGFGIVHPLPGIASGFELNTAITLPVGVEAYGAFALGAWLTPGMAIAVRRFGRRSALGALRLGMAGQVIYRQPRHCGRRAQSVPVGGSPSQCWCRRSRRGGRLFRNERGGIVGSTTFSRVWEEGSRHLALVPAQAESPLAERPYDLRHAALSTWLNAGVSPPEVAKRAGNSVEALLKR